jgi:hypothetical protein
MLDKTKEGLSLEIMKVPRYLLIPAIFITLGSPSFATTIWDNGTPDLERGYFSDFGAGQQLGDNITVATTATANQIQWWGGYFRSSTPTGPDAFTIRFFNIVAGVPDIAPLFSYSIGDVAEVDTGLDFFGSLNLYVYSATIPDTLLAPGSYLVSIVNNTPGGDGTWLWATSSQSGLFYTRNNEGEAWRSGTFAELAFNVSGPMNGTGVPESGTSVLLFGVGIAGLFCVHRRLSCADAL